MRKIIPILFTMALACSLSACAFGSNGGSGDASVSTESTVSHRHQCTKVKEKDATCLEDGNLAYWKCIGCDKIFNNQYAQTEVSLEEVIIPKLAHESKHVEASEATCDQAGNIEYWTCESCFGYFSDAECQTQITDKTSVVLKKLEHDLVHTPAKETVGKEDGNIEYWTCNICKNHYKDAAGNIGINLDSTILISAFKIPDFVVEVPEGRDPIVLQLSDTQIIDAAQERPGRGGVDRNFWATDKVEERCYDYLTEVITATNPDFIIITGDVIYGEFDDSGSALLSFISFMESFQIPWSPVFGNHDNESAKGADWQCEQFENATYCLFDQKELSGNGNYSVAIAQGNDIKRVFYMMDTNACGNASQASKDNGHTLYNYVGFKQDQIDWYTKQITELKAVSPETKISFAYHIQQAIFGKAYAQYGFNQEVKDQNINIDTHPDKAEGDFGFIGKQMKGPWDNAFVVYNAMKALGVDSIFVGHEHCNNVSVMYEGIRFQYGLKSSEYDRFNCIDAEGNISAFFGPYDTSLYKALVGGSVIVLSEEDGAIEDAYNYYCGFENGEINWDKYKKIEVNGLQYGGVNVTSAQMYADGAVTAIGVDFNGVNCYEVTANSQGKLYVNPNELRGKTTFSFSIYVPSTSTANLAGQGTFSIRLKPDDGSACNIPGAFSDGGKWYIKYSDTSSYPETKLVRDAWQTITVDITNIADTCTEFAWVIAASNVLYIKDVTIS